MMGMAQKCICCQKKRHLITSMYIFFILMVPLSTTLTQGRSIPSPTKGCEEQRMVREAVGSRPPRCDPCRKCEAVQVPVVNTRFSGAPKSRARRSVAYNRGDDTTNYKPVSWKCKCGDLFFDP